MMYNSLSLIWRRGWRRGKISAFQPQGPKIKSSPCQVLNICVTFFVKVDSAFHGVGENQFLLGAKLQRISVLSRGVSDSHPLNTTETRDKHQLQRAT